MTALSACSFRESGGDAGVIFIQDCVDASVRAGAITAMQHTLNARGPDMQLVMADVTLLTSMTFYLMLNLHSCNLLDRNEILSRQNVYRDVG